MEARLNRFVFYSPVTMAHRSTVEEDTLKSFKEGMELISQNGPHQIVKRRKTAKKSTLNALNVWTGVLRSQRLRQEYSFESDQQRTG